MDQTKTRNIGGFYKCFIIAGIVLIFLGLLWFLLSILAIWLNNSAAVWTAGLWWLFILPPFAWIFFVLAWICIVKSIEDANTKKRQVAIYGAIRQINRTFLKDTDVKMKMGSYSGWLEAMYNPKTCKCPSLTRLCSRQGHEGIEECLQEG